MANDIHKKKLKTSKKHEKSMNTCISSIHKYIRIDTHKYTYIYIYETCYTIYEK